MQLAKARAAAGALKRRARTLAGYAPLPWGIDLLLTDACNLRCTYCPITTDMKTKRPSAMMDTGKAIRFLESVAPFRPMIRVFGGEPFLHPEWPRIFAAAVSNALPITVVTNGTRLVGKAEELIRSGLLAVATSESLLYYSRLPAASGTCRDPPPPGGDCTNDRAPICRYKGGFPKSRQSRPIRIRGNWV